MQETTVLFPAILHQKQVNIELFYVFISHKVIIVMKKS